MKNVFFVFGLLTLSLLGCQKKAEEKPLPKPNILWIVSEDNSAFLGAYGDDFATTPSLDSLAGQGVLYQNAFAAAPVCAPTRNTIITGMYANSLGTENMRSTYPVPDYVRFFPSYLREAGYYTTNNSKKDYNTIDQPDCWDESSREASYVNRKSGQPFFHIRNFSSSHESSVHRRIEPKDLKHDPEKVLIPPYHPQTDEMKHDWAAYYDRIQEMDAQVGELLRELKANGQADSTIIFYYSDHGGVLGRSKRFMFESGLRVPMIVYFPEMYKHLMPGDRGTATDRIVSFVDLAPTVLSLAGIETPDYMQGTAFLGEKQGEPREYSYSFRGRMDERIDLVRSVRSKKYRYVRNYMPHKIYGQYIEYLWRAPSMPSWEAAYKNGELNDIQSAFWREKPAEELYDISSDPHNINNLAEDPNYSQVLEEHRQANRQWLVDVRDAGFIPEGRVMAIADTTNLGDHTGAATYPIEQIIDMAEIASSRDADQLDVIIKALDNPVPEVRYWALIGCKVLKKEAVAASEKVAERLTDEEITVRIAAADVMFGLGEETKSLATLEKALATGNMMARVQAINVLEDMGAPAKKLVPAVQAVVNLAPESNNYDVRAGIRLIEKFKTK